MAPGAIAANRDGYHFTQYEESPLSPFFHSFFPHNSGQRAMVLRPTKGRHGLQEQKTQVLGPKSTGIEAVSIAANAVGSGGPYTNTMLN